MHLKQSSNKWNVLFYMKADKRKDGLLIVYSIVFQIFFNLIAKW